MSRIHLLQYPTILPAHVPPHLWQLVAHGWGQIEDNGRSGGVVIGCAGGGVHEERDLVSLGQERRASNIEMCRASWV